MYRTYEECSLCRWIFCFTIKSKLSSMFIYFIFLLYVLSSDTWVTLSHAIIINFRILKLHGGYGGIFAKRGHWRAPMTLLNLWCKSYIWICGAKVTLLNLWCKSTNKIFVLLTWYVSLGWFLISLRVHFSLCFAPYGKIKSLEKLIQERKKTRPNFDPHT